MKETQLGVLETQVSSLSTPSSCQTQQYYTNTSINTVWVNKSQSESYTVTTSHNVQPHPYESIWVIVSHQSQYNSPASILLPWPWDEPSYMSPVCPGWCQADVKPCLDGWMSSAAQKRTKYEFMKIKIPSQSFWQRFISSQSYLSTTSK